MLNINRIFKPALPALLSAACILGVSFSFAFSQTGKFRRVVEEKGIKLKDVCPVDSNATARRIFADYGAVYVAANGAKYPSKCVFVSEDEVGNFQRQAGSITSTIDGISITLQKPAMEALLKAREKAALFKLRITPRGGSEAAMRSYEDTRRLWNSRFLPGLNFWVKKGKLKKSEADAARMLSTAAQVETVLNWEDTRKLYFSKDMAKSILYSVAAPGASQHISMLALDVEQFADKRVRAIMAEFGWFQTVKSDAPHFTYLGVNETALPELGLKKIVIGGQTFWSPDLD